MIRREVCGLVYLLLLLLLAISTRASPAAAPLMVQEREDAVATSSPKTAFTLDDVMTNSYASDSFNGTWMSDTEIFYRVDELLLKFDVTTQTSQLIAKEALFDDSGLKFYPSPDKSYVLIRSTEKSVYRHSSLSSYRVYNIETKKMEALADGRSLSTAFWAPVGSNLAYVFENDVYYHKMQGSEAGSRRVTFDGEPQAVYNGVPDWVYEEEVFGTDRAMWFSPSGEHLAFATFNDTQVPEAVIMKYGEPGSLEDQYPKQENFRYPKAGTTNPHVTLYLVDLTDHGSRLIPLEAPVDIVGSERILFAVTWFEAETVVATWTNRVQNLSQLVSYSLGGELQPLLTQKSPGGWLLHPGRAPLYHGSHVFLQKPQPAENASSDLFSHVTRFQLLNGVLRHEADLSPGGFWVHEIHGVSVARQAVYFTASPPGEPSHKQLYNVSIANKHKLEPPKCVSCKFKSPEGNGCKFASSVLFSPDMSHFVLTCAGPDPATIRVYDLDGDYELYTWSRNDQLRAMLTRRILPKQKDLYVESGGFNAKVRLLLPADFDESNNKTYPMLVTVYAGPDSQRINDKFSVGFESYMSTNRHVIHAWIDGRGSGSRGTAMLYAVYRELGGAEVDDQIAVAQKLQHEFPWIDSKRTAIWGWSYGGYATASALTKDNDDVFKCGISVAPVTNWIYYDSIYTERFMALPTADDNLENYEAGSVMERVENLRRKKYMLVHGTGDDNVHYQQSMALSKALAEADILYDQVSYPDEAHALSHVTRHLYHTMDKFWDECFGYDRTPRRRRTTTTTRRAMRSAVEAFDHAMAKESSTTKRRKIITLSIIECPQVTLVSGSLAFNSDAISGLSSRSSFIVIKFILFAYLYFHLAAASHAYSVVERYIDENGKLANQKPFSIDDVALYDHHVDVFNGTWISNKEIFYRRDNELYIFDVTTQKEIRISTYDPVPRDQEAFPNADRNYILFKSYAKNVNSYVPLYNYSVCHYEFHEYYYSCGNLVELVGGQLLHDAMWAPIGTALVIVLDNDIHYLTINIGEFRQLEIRIRRITTNGVIEKIFNGVADWVYGEEVYQGSHRLMWFSPSGAHLAFITLNDSNVEDMVISRYNNPGTLDDQYPEVVKYKYPKAGKPIPEVTLNLIDLTNNESSLVSLPAPTDVGLEPILYAVSWLDDKTIVTTWTNRAQNYSQIVTYSVDGLPTTMLTQESPAGWLLDDITSQSPMMFNNYLVLIEIQAIDNLKLGSFPHVIRYHMENGKLSGRVDLTPEATWVTKIVGIDKSRHTVYYIASPPGEPSQKHLYAVDFKVSKPKCLSCEIKTPEGNACKTVGEVIFSDDFSYCALACIGPDPTSIGIYNAERHVHAFEWFTNAQLRQMLDERMLPKILDLEIPANGFDAKVRLLLPVEFDATKKYPMIVKVYGGPNSQAVSDEFAIGFEQYMTTRRQVICAFIDGRGTSCKGTAMMYAVYRKLGSAEMEDQITVTRKLQETYSWIDSNRTGIWGRSYGGYSTATILTKDDSNVFKCGISVAPVTSWLYYDAIYTERYMGQPREEDNLKGYQASQVTDNAKKLQSKLFMLVHGTGDDNVHLQHSMALSKALVNASVLFEQFFYSDEYHPLNKVYAHLYHTFDKFFSQCFGYDFD